MAYPPTCLSCHHPFPPASALLTSSFGRRIAIDPTHRRAWRICERCGKWNLLGPEEGPRLIDEATSRFAGVAIRGVDLGIDQADLGDVTVLRLDLTPGEAVNAGVAERHAAVERRQTRLALFFLLMTVAAGAFLIREWRAPDSDPDRRWQLLSTPLMVIAASVYAAARRRRRLGFPTSRGSLFAVGTLLAAGVLLAARHPTLGAWSLVPALLGGTVTVWMDRWLPVGRIRLPSGRRLWIRREELDFSRVGIGEDGTLRLTLPSGRHLDRADSEAMLRDLLDGLSWEGSEPMQRAGFAIARGENPLPRVLEMLRPMMAESPDGVPLAKLPGAWRAALDLSLAASTGTPGKLSALAEKAREAQQVAAIAESLDRPDG